MAMNRNVTVNLLAEPHWMDGYAKEALDCDKGDNKIKTTRYDLVTVLHVSNEVK